MPVVLKTSYVESILGHGTDVDQCACGGAPEVRAIANYFRVRCSLCGATGHRGDTVVDAVRAWNADVAADHTAASASTETSHHKVSFQAE